jgi:UDP-glucose/galactose:(glucosyl)LPS alpha-1,2-glucosyl/galactosyltransferase
MDGVLDEPIVIALAFDSKYVAPAATVIKSCLMHHHDGELRFEIIHDDTVSAEDLHALRKMCDERGAYLNTHLIDEPRLEHLPVIDRFGSIVWSRFFLPELLETIPKVLYLDCDVLVLSSLRPLWCTDLGTASLGAVANVVEPYAREHVAKLGIRYPGGFFNSGVLLFRLDCMRRDRCTEQLTRFALDHADELMWPDQDALNVVFEDRWHPLHPKWNAQNSLWSWGPWAEEVFGPSTAREAVAAPVIRHFEGPSVAKPWHFLCPAPHRDIYLATLAKTPWAGEALEDRTLMTRAIALLPERRRLHVYRRAAEARAAIRSRVTRRRQAGIQRATK